MVGFLKFQGVDLRFLVVCLLPMLALLIVLLSGLSATIGGEPEFLCMFWNVENLFESKPHFRDKCNGIAKTVMLAADEFGGAPDIIGLAEVENRDAVRKLVSQTGLRRFGYSAVHFDSPDRRGIDCALLYRREKFHVLHTKPCHLTDSCGSFLPTRDILLTVLKSASLPEGIPPSGVRPSGSPHHPFGLPAALTAVLINHHPSKVGKGSEERRKIAMARLMFLRDSLLAEGITQIVAIGDFNDTVLPAPGVEAAYPPGAGTIKFQGKWEKIDGCPVLEGLSAREYIFAPPHLSTRDRRYSGVKPLRSFSGPRYLGGISDHYPVVLECYLPAPFPKTP